jgi:hypothetical protein
MMYPIRIVKLISGEVLVCGIAETGGVYTLERPMSISLVPTIGKDKRQETMVFMKNWIEFSNDEMYIVPKDRVMCISTPDSGILRDYNDAKIKFDLFEAQDDLDAADDDFDDEGEEIEDEDGDDSP